MRTYDVVRPSASTVFALRPASCSINLLAGGLTIFALELIESAFLEDNDDARMAYRGVFRVFGAMVFTHLGVSILKQGSSLVRSSSFYEVW